MVVQHLHVNEKWSVGERRLWVRLNFSSRMYCSSSVDGFIDWRLVVVQLLDGPRLSSNTCMSMWSGPWENVVYEFVLTFLFRIYCSSSVDGFRDGRLVVVQLLDGPRWSSNTCMSTRSGPWENVVYEFILTFLCRIYCSSSVDGLRDERLVAVQLLDGPRLSSNPCMLIWSGLWENVVYEFILTFPAECIVCLVPMVLETGSWWSYTC